MGVESASYVEQESVRHNCGIVGIYAPGRDVVGLTNIALQHLNHRGQEGAGMIALTADGRVNIHTGEGYARNVFTKEAVEHLRQGDPILAIGHDRYSTSGSLKRAWQPFYSQEIGIGFEHNGNITNAMELYYELSPKKQAAAVTDSDVVVKHIEQAPGKTLNQKIAHTVLKCEGAYNFIISAADGLRAVKDPWDMRPLQIGVLPVDDNGKQGYVVASEDAAFAHLEAKHVRDVRPGEGVLINEDGIQTFFLDKRVGVVDLARCIFEYVYLSAPDSVIWGKPVFTIRKTIGGMLAQKDIDKGFMPDAIVPVQHSGIPYAEGYSEKYIEEISKDPSKFGLKWEDLHKILPKLVVTTGLIANSYSGRTFIFPEDRLAGVNGKHRPVEAIVKSKNIVLVDDSIVRGTTSPRINNLIRKYGANSTHDRIGSPPIRFPCFQGVDFATRDELIANKVAGPIEEGVRNLISADSLRYITPQELLTAVIGEEEFSRFYQQVKANGNFEEGSNDFDADLFRIAGYCGACFLGRYPMDVNKEKGVFKKEIIK